MRGGARVLLNRVLLGHTALNSPDTEPLIPYLHAALGAVANAPAEAADTDRPSDDTAAN